MKKDMNNIDLNLQMFAEPTNNEPKSAEDIMNMSEEDALVYLTSKGVIPKDSMKEEPKVGETEPTNTTEPTPTEPNATKADETVVEDIQPKNDEEVKKLTDLVKSLQSDIQGLNKKLMEKNTMPTDKSTEPQKQMTEEELEELRFKENEALSENPKEYIAAIVEQAIAPYKEEIERQKAEKIYLERANKFFNENPDANAEEIFEFLQVYPELDKREDALETVYKLAQYNKLKEKPVYDNPEMIKGNKELVEQLLGDEEIFKAFEKKYIESHKKNNDDDAPQVIGGSDGGKPVESSPQKPKNLKEAAKFASDANFDFSSLIKK